MNSYLLNRALGSITPHSFHVAQTTRLVHHLEPAPRIRFSSQRDISGGQSERDSALFDANAGIESDTVAHRAGVNVLAIDQNDSRLYALFFNQFRLMLMIEQHGFRWRRSISSFLGSGNQRRRVGPYLPAYSLYPQGIPRRRPYACDHVGLNIPV
jgi:hypothetical protein